MSDSTPAPECTIPQPGPSARHAMVARMVCCRRQELVSRWAVEVSPTDKDAAHVGWRGSRSRLGGANSVSAIFDATVAMLKLYELHIATCNDSVVVHFRPVAASVRRKYLALTFGIDAVIIVMLGFLFQHWWAWLFFPFLVAYGTWSAYRHLHLREELRLERKELSVAAYFDECLRGVQACKPAFVTNVRFSGPGHHQSSYIRLEVEGRRAKFAEGINYGDACTILAALADSDLLPNPARVHFE